MRECDIDWCALARDQATRNMVNLCQLSFQKKLRSSVFCLSWLSDGRYPGYLAKFCRLKHTVFYFPVKKTYLIPTFQLQPGG